MKKPKRGWEILCGHANEVPNVCPCPDTCGCRYYSCRIPRLEDLEPWSLTDNDVKAINRHNDTKPYVAGVLKRGPITFDIDNYAFEKKVVKYTKLGQKVHLHIPISDTHEVKITSRVVSKRKVRRK